MSFRILFVLALLGACNRQPAPPAQASASTTALAGQQGAGTAAPVDTAMERVDKARIQGSPDAKVWMVVASDFQCPFCRDFHDDVYKQVLKDYVATGKVRVAFLNHPMSFHPLAIPAAEAAMCAGAQDRFWEMHDALFITQGKWTKVPDPLVTFDSLATSLKLRMDDWRRCVSTHATKPMIEEDLARSKKGGVGGTPSFFIADRLAIEGAQPYAMFRSALDAAIAQAGGAPAGGGQKP